MGRVLGHFGHFGLALVPEWPGVGQQLIAADRIAYSRHFSAAALRGVQARESLRVGADILDQCARDPSGAGDAARGTLELRAREPSGAGD